MDPENKLSGAGGMVIPPGTGFPNLKACLIASTRLLNGPKSSFSKPGIPNKIPKREKSNCVVAAGDGDAADDGDAAGDGAVAAAVIAAVIMAAWDGVGEYMGDVWYAGVVGWYMGDKG